MRVLIAILFHLTSVFGIHEIEIDNNPIGAYATNNGWCDGVTDFGGHITEESFIAYNFDLFEEPIRKPCTWKITAPPNKVVVLRISKLRTASPPECFSQYLDVYDTNKQRLARLCGTIEDSTPVYSTGNTMTVTFNPRRMPHEILRAAVGFSYGAKSDCGGIVVVNSTKSIQPPDLDDLQCFWKLRAPRNHQIVIQFTEQNLPSTCSVGNQTLSACDCASIEIRDGGGPFSNLLTRVCSNQTGSEVRTVAQVGFVAFRLRGRQNNAFKISVEPVQSPCGDIMIKVNSTKQVLQTPGYPLSYPSVRCFYHFVAEVDGSRIMLRFKDFDLTPEKQFPQHGHVTRCLGDSANIVEDMNENMVWRGLGPRSTYMGETKRAFLKFYEEISDHTFCGNHEKPFDYISATSSATLFVNPRKEAKNRGRGLMVEYSLVGCNRNYTELSGRITNGNDRSNCNFSITVPENRTISLYFNHFYINRTPNCTNATFVVRDASPDGNILLKACGYFPPDPVFSFTNKLFIQTINTNPGWIVTEYDLEYVSTEGGRGCGGDIYSYRGTVYSPLYPNSYNEDTECLWTVRVPVGLHTALKVRKFDLKGNCTANYLTVLTYTVDEDGQPIERATKYCPGDKPDVLRSESLIKIKYKSSSSRSGSGWYALYQGIRPSISELY